MTKIIICGPAGSGKTTLAKNLTKWFNLKQIIQTTNRPIREGEKDTIDYYFTNNNLIYSENEIENFNNGFVEFQYFEYVNWYYGTKEIDFLENDILVVNPKSLKQIEEYKNGIYSENLLKIYLDPPKSEILKRLKDRNDQNNKILERLEQDFSDFENFSNWDIRITNPNYLNKLSILINK